MNENNNTKTGSCVACDVKTCIYHANSDTCSAGKIKVSNSTATTCRETNCDTFECR